MRDEWNITWFDVVETEDEIVRTTGNPALTPFRYQTKRQLVKLAQRIPREVFGPHFCPAQNALSGRASSRWCFRHLYQHLSYECHSVEADFE
jgi:hypothetical protein